MAINYKLDLGNLGPIATLLQNKINESFETAQRIQNGFVTEFSNRVIDRTPVDTGRCKRNNQIGINDVAAQSLNEYDREGTSTKLRNAQAISKAELGDTLTIFNNLTYAPNLEHGSSTQAPEGFYRTTLAEAEEILAEVAAREIASPGVK